MKNKLKKMTVQQLLGEDRRWRSKLTLATHKLAEVREEINLRLLAASNFQKKLKEIETIEQNINDDVRAVQKLVNAVAKPSAIGRGRKFQP